MEKIDNKIFLDWSDIDHLVNKLCDEIKSSPYTFNKIFALPRGGLIPGVMISHKLGLPLSFSELDPKTLIIDDICDSGKTLKNFLPKHIIGVLHHKPHTADITPNLYAETHRGDEWIIYPWENINSETIQDYKKVNIYKQV